jgi:hypothetical protein
MKYKLWYTGSSGKKRYELDLSEDHISSTSNPFISLGAKRQGLVVYCLYEKSLKKLIKKNNLQGFNRKLEQFLIKHYPRSMTYADDRDTRYVNLRQENIYLEGIPDRI